MVTRIKTPEVLQDPSGVSLGHRRPVPQEKRHVANDILCAAVAFLENKSPQQITIKEIAAMAGTRPTMVYYYFGGMEGLLLEIIRVRLKEITDEYDILWNAIRRNEVEDPLRALISLLASSFNDRPSLSRLLVSEMFREESPIRDNFLKQWAAHGKLILHDVITHLATTGYYRQNINVEGVVSLVRSVIFFPLIMKPYVTREDGFDRHYLDDQWIEFVTDFFGCYLRPSNLTIVR